MTRNFDGLSCRDDDALKAITTLWWEYYRWFITLRLFRNCLGTRADKDDISNRKKKKSKQEIRKIIQPPAPEEDSLKLKILNT